MDRPLVFALGALLCYGLSDFVYKRAAAASIRADRLVMVQAWFFVPLVILYALASGRLVPVAAAAWGLLAGVLSLAGFYFFARSLALGAVSTNASIFRLNFIVTVVLVIGLLGEPLTILKALGLAFALLATWLLVAARSDGEQRPGRDGKRSLVEVAIATLSFGASNFVHTVGLRHGALPETLAVAQAAVFMPLATLSVYLADRRLRPATATYGYSAVTAVLLFGATILLLRGIAAGQATVVVPVSQMGFIVAAVLGVTVLGERLTPRKAIGLVAALAALAVLAASSPS
ncbi:MAG: EamA family transporter [Rhodospirillaceae bacterium]